MKTIKFRGYSTDLQKWVYGFYVNKGGIKHQIVAEDKTFPIIVAEESIGQSLGIENNNGVELFEGDIIQKPNGNWGVLVYKAPFFEVTVSETQSSLYRKDFIQDSIVIGNTFETNLQTLKK